MEWMILPYKRYAEFDGRSQRMEYWMFMLFWWVVTLVSILFIAAVENFVNPSRGFGEDLSLWSSFGLSLLVIFWIGSIVPYLAVGVRRFHDVNMTGLVFAILALLSGIPILGLIFSLAITIIAALPGTDGRNKHGPDPKGGGTDTDEDTLHNRDKVPPRTTVKLR